MYGHGDVQTNLAQRGQVGENYAYLRHWLSQCVQIMAFCQKLNKILGPSWNPSQFKALCGHSPEQNAGTIQASNPEHLRVFIAHRGTIRNRTQC